MKKYARKFEIDYLRFEIISKILQRHFVDIATLLKLLLKFIYSFLETKDLRMFTLMPCLCVNFVLHWLD